MSKLGKPEKNLILFLIFNICIISLIKCNSEDKGEKQMRFDACYKLVGKKVHKNNNYFKDLSSDPNVVNEIIQDTIFNCYHLINYYDAEDIDNTPVEKLNVDKEDYAEYSNLKKWESLILSGNQEEINEAKMEIQDAFIDVQSGAIDMSYLKENGGRDYMNRPKNQNKKVDDERDMSGVMGGKDLIIFGYNFSNMSDNVKNIVGISLIIIIFILIIFGLKWIQSIRNGGIGGNKKKDKKDKKKKKQN